MATIQRGAAPSPGLAQAGRMTAAEAFSAYDYNHNGSIEVDELRALLKDLGLLEGRSPADASAWVAQQFALADGLTKDNKLDLAEFTRFYSKVTAPRLLDALAAKVPEDVERLREVFTRFATFGTRNVQTGAVELDGARWIKLCKETKLIDRQLTTTDCDLMFTKAKERSARKLTFEQFLDALYLIATKKKQAVLAVVRQVADADGPTKNNTTVAESVRFHDDTSTYTGVYARRTSGAAEGPMSSPVRRRSTTPSVGSELVSPGPASSTASRTRHDWGEVEVDGPDEESRNMLREAFVAFASFGLGGPASPGKSATEMDNKQFIKLCRESGIIDRKMTTTHCDLAFTKARAGGARKIVFNQFLVAVALLAKSKGVPKDELYSMIASCSPQLNSTITLDDCHAPQFETDRRLSVAPAEEEGSEAGSPVKLASPGKLGFNYGLPALAGHVDLLEQLAAEEALLEQLAAEEALLAQRGGRAPARAPAPEPAPPAAAEEEQEWAPELEEQEEEAEWAAEPVEQAAVEEEGRLAEEEELAAAAAAERALQEQLMLQMMEAEQEEGELAELEAEETQVYDLEPAQPPAEPAVVEAPAPPRTASPATMDAAAGAMGKLSIGGNVVNITATAAVRPAPRPVSSAPWATD